MITYSLIVITVKMKYIASRWRAPNNSCDTTESYLLESVLTLAFFLCLSHMNCPNCVWMPLWLLHVCRHGDCHLLWIGYTPMLMMPCDITEHENMHTGWGRGRYCVYAKPFLKIDDFHASVVIGNLQSFTSVILKFFRFMVCQNKIICTVLYTDIKVER